MTGSTTLAPIDRLRMAVESIETLPEAKDVRDRAEALRVYAKQARLGLDVQNEAATIKLRAERRAGEILSQTPIGATRFGAGSDAVSLSELGIAAHQSSRWQKLARIPAPRFEEYLAGTAGRELTQAGALGLLRVAPTKVAKWKPPVAGKVEPAPRGHFKTDQGAFRDMVFNLSPGEVRDLAGCIFSLLFSVSERDALDLVERLVAHKDAHGWDATLVALNAA